MHRGHTDVKVRVARFCIRGFGMRRFGYNGAAGSVGERGVNVQKSTTRVVDARRGRVIDRMARPLLAVVMVSTALLVPRHNRADAVDLVPTFTPAAGGHQHSALQMDHHVRCPGELDDTPLGALPPAKPMLCDRLGAAVDTASRGRNRWVDNFNHGATMSRLAKSYVQGHVGSGGVSRHFIHNNHWMVDIRSDSGRYPTLLAAWMRPAARFKPKRNGAVVIQFEVATPIAGTRGTATIDDSWPEFAISKAPAPTGTNPWRSPFLRNGTYFYEAFAGANVMGCRLQQSRHPICAFYRAGSDTAGAPDRLWEINQNGTDVRWEYGGDPAVSRRLRRAWATCSSRVDPDVKCRNVFRVRLTANRIRIDVKKPGGRFVRYYEAVPCNDRAGCQTGQMRSILNARRGFYVYFADFAYRIENNEVIRFHWDRIAINP
jgi:hypothetical protein